MAVTLHFRLILKGTTLFFIHGAGNNCMVWDDVVNTVNITNISIDLPGHGKASGKSYKTIQGYGRFIIRCIEDMDINDVVLVGHSMGGAIVQYVMAQNPPWLKAGVLVATGPRLRVNPAIIEGLKENPEKMLQKIVGWAVHKEAPQEIKEKALEIFSEAKPEVTINDFIACDRFNGEKLCQKIEKPVLIVAADKDLMTPLKLSEELFKLIKNSKLEVIKDCGHMIPLEKPAELCRLIEDFLS